MKFKIGDKVVFVDDSEITYTGSNVKWTPTLKKFGIYEVVDYTDLSMNKPHMNSVLRVNGHEEFFNEKRFVSLKEFRKNKIKKILL